MTRELAIHGGEPVRREPFPAHMTIGTEEQEAVLDVLKCGALSKYLGTWTDGFMGGTRVRALEEEWAEYFGAKHAIAVNSCTSGLYCAVAAIGVGPGDEVIVSPYTMSASATAPLICGGVPVFADIEDDCFCLDSACVEARITPRTKAIVAVDIFGQPYNVDAINAIADRHGLKVIEDCAQAPGGCHAGRFAGTLGDIGVFSLNYHKHIHCGEGGVVVTDNDEFAERLQLVRNHAEAVVEAKGVTNLVNMVGFNYRMTEMAASVARCQLGKLAELLSRRRENCTYIERGLSGIPALTMPKVRDKCEHAYYIHAIKFDREIAGVSRNVFVEAVRAELAPFKGRETEGVNIGSGYVKPLYLQPMFQQQIALGSHGYPFTSPWYDGETDYAPGCCPTAEAMHYRELIAHEMMLPSMGRDDLDDVIAAFNKVWEGRDSLMSSDGAGMP